MCSRVFFGFPSGSDGKESAGNVGDLGSIPGSGRSPGGGRGTPLQHSCLENPVDRGAWCTTAHRVTESDTTERLSTAHRCASWPRMCCILADVSCELEKSVQH